ncbi:MAG: heme-binding domain-containing protein [Ignavibacteriales bacterium]|nr:heme-binding domain-containing protein [Ignavibacteriales bacterium]
MKKYLKWAAVGFGAIFLGIQAVQPDRTNPPVDETQTIEALLKAPPQVLTIIQRSCFDCHSNKTNWPWYSYVAPSSWLVASDVKNARAQMNFSEWGKYKGLRAVSKLDQICMNVDQGTMPLPIYLIMHPSARLSKAEIDTICAWVEAESERLSE